MATAKPAQKWRLNLAKNRRSNNYPDPTGMVRNFSTASDQGPRSERDIQDVVASKLSSLAYGPAKQILMVGIMYWMTGNNLNIFTIMFTVSMLIQPINSIMNMQKSKSDITFTIDMIYVVVIACVLMFDSIRAVRE